MHIASNSLYANAGCIFLHGLFDYIHPLHSWYICRTYKYSLKDLFSTLSFKQYVTVHHRSTGNSCHWVICGLVITARVHCSSFDIIYMYYSLYFYTYMYIFYIIYIHYILYIHYIEIFLYI